MNSSKINELKNLKEQNQTEEKKKNVSFNVNIKNNESIEMDDKLSNNISHIKFISNIT